MARNRKTPKAGVTIHAGDTVTIPPGQIRVSLKRDSGSGTFTRQGIAWFMQMLYCQGMAETPSGLDAQLQTYLEAASSLLESSPLLTDVDLNSEAGASAAMQRLADRNDSIEGWALRVIAGVGQVRAAIAENDTLTTAWAMGQLTNCRAMLLFKRELEELVWRGYKTDERNDSSEGSA